MCHLKGETGCSTVCAYGKLKQNLPNGKFGSRLAFGTVIYSESGPETGRKKLMGHNFPFGYSGWEFWVVYHLHGQTGRFTVWVGLGKW